MADKFKDISIAKWKSLNKEEQGEWKEVIKSTFLGMNKKTMENRTEDGKAAKMDRDVRKKNLQLMSGIFKQSKITSKAVKVVSSHWGKLLGLALFLLPKKFWVGLKEAIYIIYDFFKSGDWKDHIGKIGIGLGLLAAMLHPTAALLVALGAFKTMMVGLSAMSWFKDILKRTPAAPVPVGTGTGTGTGTPSKSVKDTMKTTVKPTTPVKPSDVAKKAIKVTSLGRVLAVARVAGTALVGLSIGKAFYDVLNQDKKPRPTPEDARLQNNEDSRTPNKASSMMDSGLKFFTDIPKALAADFASSFSSSSSEEIKEDLDKAQKDLGKKYVKTLQKTGKVLDDTFTEIKKIDLITPARKGYNENAPRSKPLTDDFVPQKNSDSINRNTKQGPKEKKGWFGNAWDGLKKGVSSGTDYIKNFQTMDKSDEPSTGRKKMSQGAFSPGTTKEKKPDSYMQFRKSPPIQVSGSTTNMSGVKWNKMHEEGRAGVESVIWDIYNQHGKKPVFTSGLRDKDHPLYNKNSQHAYGLGFDLRSHSLGAKQSMISNDLSNAFNGNGWFMQEELKGQINSNGSKATAGHFHVHMAAKGFHGEVNKPTGFIAGEAGRERVDITPLHTPESRLASFNNLQSQNLDAQRMGGGGGGGTTIVAPQTTKVSQSSTTAVISAPTAKDSFWNNQV